MPIISLDGDPSLGDIRSASKDHAARSNDFTDMQAMASSQHSASIVSLLQQILEQQQAQVSLQKDHLSILKRSAFPAQHCHTDSAASPAGDNSHSASEDKFVKDAEKDDDGQQRVSQQRPLPIFVRQEPSQARNLSKMLAIDNCAEYCPTPKETVKKTISKITLNGLPSGLMTDAMVSRQLFMAGVFPKGMFQQKWRCSVYHAVLVAAEVFHCLVHIKTIFCDIVLDQPLTSAAPILLLSQVVLVHPLWRVWIKEFDATGATFQLLHQMDKRGMAWSALRRSVRMCHVISILLAIVIAGLWYSVFSNGSTYTQYSLRQKGSTFFQVLGRVSAVIDAFGILSQFLWISIAAPIHVWIVYMVSSLHRYDLLSYAVAMEKAFDSDDSDPGVEFVPALKTLENVVTARLRLASGGWVRCVVFNIACMCCGALALCMLLLTSDNLSFFLLVTYSSCAIFFFGFIAALCLPLAMVAEVFEYDVVRALNNPFILNIAQKHIGQQLLPHLKHLDWGFRVGGTTITASLVANLATGVLVTMITAVSQAAFNRAGVRS